MQALCGKITVQCLVQDFLCSKFMDRGDRTVLAKLDAYLTIPPPHTTKDTFFKRTVFDKLPMSVVRCDLISCLGLSRVNFDGSWPILCVHVCVCVRMYVHASVWSRIQPSLIISNEPPTGQYRCTSLLNPEQQSGRALVQSRASISTVSLARIPWGSRRA